MVTTTHPRAIREIDPRVALYAAELARNLALPSSRAVLAAADLEAATPSIGDASLRDRVDVVARALDEILLVIDEMLALAAFGGHTATISARPTDLRRFLQETLAEFHDRIPAIEVSLACREDAEVNIDPLWMKRAVFFLLRHASREASGDSLMTLTAYAVPTLAIVAFHHQGRPKDPRAESDGITPDPTLDGREWWFELVGNIVGAQDGTLWRDRSLRYSTKYIMALPPAGTADPEDR